MAISRATVLSLLILSGLLATLGCNPAESLESVETELEPLPVDEAMNQATQAATEGESEAALTFVKRGLRADPQHRELLLWAGGLLVKRGIGHEQDDNKKQAAASFQQAAKYLNQLAEQHEDLNQRERAFLALVAFHQATSAAKEDNATEALEKLRRALDYGFDDLTRIEESPDWADVRKQSAYESLASNFRAQLMQSIEQETKEELESFESFEFDFQLPGIDDSLYTKDQYQGKVLIIDMWGTWCPPCRREIPHFAKLYENYRSKGLEIVGINYEKGTRETAIRKIRTFEQNTVEIPYPLVLGDQETKEQIPDFGGFPTTLFIDRSGKVRLSLVGYHRYEKLEHIAKRLLGE